MGLSRVHLRGALVGTVAGSIVGCFAFAIYRLFQGLSFFNAVRSAFHPVTILIISIVCAPVGFAVGAAWSLLVARSDHPAHNGDKRRTTHPMMLGAGIGVVGLAVGSAILSILLTASFGGEPHKDPTTGRWYTMRPGPGEYVQEWFGAFLFLLPFAALIGAVGGFVASRISRKTKD